MLDGMEKKKKDNEIESIGTIEIGRIVVAALIAGQEAMPWHWGGADGLEHCGEFGE